MIDSPRRNVRTGTTRFAPSRTRGSMALQEGDADLRTPYHDVTQLQANGRAWADGGRSRSRYRGSSDGLDRALTPSRAVPRSLLALDPSRIKGRSRLAR